MQKYKVILGSTSIYRKELLSRLKIEFDAVKPLVDEELIKKELGEIKPKELAIALAKKKAESLLKQHESDFIVGSDQVLEFQGKIFGQPKTKANAINMLKELRGNTHKLHTAVTIISPQGLFEHCDTTSLSMYELSDEEIIRYIDLDDPLFCAGSYKLESLGLSMIKEIKSNDQTAIIGLPMLYVNKILREHNISALLP